MELARLAHENTMEASSIANEQAKIELEKERVKMATVQSTIMCEMMALLQESKSKSK